MAELQNNGDDRRVLRILHLGRYTGCQVCADLDEMPEQGFTTHSVLESTVGDGQLGVKERAQMIDDFLLLMNALLNSGGGRVIIHTEHPYLLGLFDEQVDDKLKKLIPDDSLFSDNFERHFDDEKHILFRVKPQQNTPLLSSLACCSKVSLDRGLDEITIAQMRRLLTISEGGHQDPGIGNTIYAKQTISNFQHGKEVSAIPGVFKESCSTQAKRISKNVYQLLTTPPRPQGKSKAELLADYCWKDLSLPLYITAFSKQSAGGSLYVGLQEEQKGQQKFKRVSGVPDHVMGWLTTLGQGIEIWEDDKGKYRLMEEKDVPRWRTGRFLCEGVPLEQGDFKDFRQIIEKKVHKEMLWLSYTPSKASKPPVEVILHNTKSGRGIVVEFAVKKFDGVSFYDAPRSYMLKKTNPLTPQLVPLSDWVSKQTEGTRTPELHGLRRDT